MDNFQKMVYFMKKVILGTYNVHVNIRNYLMFIPQSWLDFICFIPLNLSAMEEFSYTKIAMAYSHIALFDILLNINMYIF